MSCGFEPLGEGSGFGWYPPSAPDVSSIDLSFGVSALATGYEKVLAESAPIEVRSIPLKVARPRPISVRIGRQPVCVRSFAFPQPADDRESPAEADRKQRGGCRLLATMPSSSTRIRPPRDVIKLEDRLHYLLQPSLEVLLAQRSLEFPFRPFPFQLEGVAFLYPRHAAVLADEMGLGKTMQAITAVRLLLRSGELQRVLFVCPKPLVSNWQREFAVWAPEIPVLIIEGDQARRCWQWQLPDVPVKIANYELLHRDRELFEPKKGPGLICAKHPPGRSGKLNLVPFSAKPIDFDLVVLDESQRIKNPSSATNQAARAIGRRRNWALTGTPVENSAEDLVGIFEFLAPGFISPEMKPRRMGRTVSDYVLRRTKDQVLTDLPPKLFRDADLDLTPEQRETYQVAEEEGVLRLAEMSQSATIQHVFELVLRLKQICNFDPVTGASSKLERLEADVEELATSGRKAILFSQWVQTLKQLSRKLAAFGPLEYHGQIPQRRRDAVIGQFRDDPNSHLLLMSYGAGGVGLNLQFASYVFLFDRWWNPAVEDQAINRAHRIGVAGPVTVTRFLMLDTIEERIDRILQEKRELFDMIFSGTQAHHKLGLTGDELFGLFDLRYPAGPIDLAA